MKQSENIWDSESIKRFWDYCSRRNDIQDNYFSKQVGEGITNFLKYAKIIKSENPKRQMTLDFGCGPGYLLNHLLKTGLTCFAFDYSLETVKKVNANFRDRENWKGAVHSHEFPIQFHDNFFDLIFCIETIEHVLDQDIEKVLKEIYRLLRPGGVGVFTVPANENLSDNMVYCPFCNSVFHKIQHLRSFSVSSLVNLLSSHVDIEIIFCNKTNFMHFQSKLPRWSLISLSTIAGLIFPKLLRIVDSLLLYPWNSGLLMRYGQKYGPHLCAIVKKKLIV